MKLNVAVIKRHPYITGGVVLFGGIAIWYFFLRGSSAGNSGTVVTSGGVDPNTAAQLSTSQQEQAAQIAYQLAALTQNNQTQLAALNAQLQVKANEDAYGYNLGSQQLADQTAVSMATLKNQADITTATLNEKLAEDKLTASLQQNLAAINAQLQSNLSAQQSANFQAQLHAQTIINGQNVGAIMNGQDDASTASTLGTIATIAAIAFL